MIRKSIALATAFVVSLVIVSVPISAQADTISPEECYPAVLMLKGSGEGIVDGKPVEPVIYAPSSSPSTPFITTNGHEGAVLGRLLEAFVNKTDPSETVSKVRFIGIEYPALPVIPEMPTGLPANMHLAMVGVTWGVHIMAYNESYRTGAQMALDFIKEDEERGCNTQYMLLAYSQGVISARLTMNLLDNNTDKVISSYVVGDPFQKPNGASSSRQKTAANTGSDTSGVGVMIPSSIVAFNEVLAYQLPISELATAEATEALSAYINEMTRADPVIYRDDGEGNIVSRSLCHRYDPTCNFSGLDTNVDEHINYFDVSTPAGALDLELEVAEFDKQVRMLANSTAQDPRERTLTRTPALLDQTTTYSVANAQPDDKCTWDEDSDGIPEVINGSCTTYNTVPTSEVTEMTVTVTDSFGITHILRTETKTIDTSHLDALTSLDPDTWYQFRPLQNPYAGTDQEEYWTDSCLTNNQDYYGLLEEWLQPLSFTSSCEEATSEHVAQLSTQVFRPAKYPTPQGEETRMLWGYDDRFAWSAGSYYTDPQLVSEDSSQNITPRLAQIIDGVPYYVFQHKGLCLAYNEDYYGIVPQKCDYSDEKQLFSAFPLSDQYGNLSIERDTTPPSPITNLRAVVTPYVVWLEWEPSTDMRTPHVYYYIYKMDPDTGEYNQIATMPYQHLYSSTVFYELNVATMDPGESYTYKVVAVDFANNVSEAGLVTFQAPTQ